MGGPIARIRDGDMIRIDADNGILELSTSDNWQDRDAVSIDLNQNEYGNGRELFHLFRQSVSSASSGAVCFGDSNF